MHIGIILDGNRRYAKKLLMQPWKGHELGMSRVEKLIDWAIELNVNELTLYAFSLENFGRDEKEVAFLMKIFMEAFGKMEKDIMKKGVRVNFMGRLALLPADLQALMGSLMKKSAENKALILNIAIAYGGKEEIVDAAKRILKDAEAGKLKADDLDEDSFSDYLYLKDEPDIIIRTGAAMRLSNFLPYQSAYSELFFLDKMWPEFGKEDLVKCIREFGQRERRFGK
jgi:tritrans,polycis-undecaprenyl-diphosphate synthase [geranylgeranyl-diphosphate specific]